MQENKSCSSASKCDDNMKNEGKDRSIQRRKRNFGRVKTNEEKTWEIYKREARTSVDVQMNEIMLVVRSVRL